MRRLFVLARAPHPMGAPIRGSEMINVAGILGEADQAGVKSIRPLALLGTRLQILLAIPHHLSGDRTMRLILVALSLVLSINVAAAQGTPTAGAPHAVIVMPD